MPCEHRNKFCFVCGLFVDFKHENFLDVNPSVVLAYEFFFDIPCDVWDYTPQVCCMTCARTLRGWRNGEKRALSFETPMRWIEGAISHDEGTCFFCVNKNTCIRYTDRYTVEMIPTENVVLPVERATGHSLPVPPSQDVVQSNFDNEPTVQIEDDDQMQSFLLPIQNFGAIAGPSHRQRITQSTNVTGTTETSGTHSEYIQPQGHRTEKHTITEAEFDDFCRDFTIPIYKSEELLSRFKNWNLIDPSVTIAHIRGRHHVFDQFFDEDSSLVYCSDIVGLFERFSHAHNPDEWTLFMDSSTQSM